MARVCSITGKKVLVGNKVSHANNKSKRRFLPNLQEVSLVSDALGRQVRLQMSTNGLRTIESHGGLDAFLLQAKPSALQPDVQKLKRVIAKRLAAQS